MSLRPLLPAALAVVAACAGPPEEDAREVGGLEEIAEILRTTGAREVEVHQGAAVEEVAPAAALDSDPDAPPTPAQGAPPTSEDPEALPAEDPEAPPTQDPEAPPTQDPEAPPTQEAAAEDAATQGGAEPAPQSGAVVPQEPQRRVNPYLEFGSRIIVHAGTDLITKPFPIQVGRGQKIVELMTKYSGLPLRAASDEGPPAEEGEVVYELLQEWDVEPVIDLRQSPMQPAQSRALADWLVITTTPELMHEVESFLNLFAAAVPQIEIEAQIVEISTTDTLDIGVRSPAGTSLLEFPDATLVDAFDFTLPNTVDVNEALLSLSAVQDEVGFNMLIEALQTWDNVSIKSRPKIAVREGLRAEIINTTDIPFFQVTGINPNGNASITLKFQTVGVQLYVVPRVVGSDWVSLELDLEASQQVGQIVAFATTDQTGEGETTSVPTPVIATRKARTTVYLQPGQGLILGGLRSERVADQERKVPLLGDIPLLGWLFRSTFQRKETTEVLFFIRPRILGGADLARDF